MDKSCHSASESSNNNTTGNNNSDDNTSIGNRDQYLKHLNRLSHKISKPGIKKPSFDDQGRNNLNPPPISQQNQAQQLNLPPPLPQQHQPPVYNINKSDFRDVVQKLTGSPAHERFTTPPPIQQPKHTSSRLQKIRPPPLPQLSSRPPPLMKYGSIEAPPVNPNNSISASSSAGSGNFQRQPLSPLPPFPTVHAAAESPISAYMRYLQSSNSNLDSDSKIFSGFSPLGRLVSPRRNNFAQPTNLPENSQTAASTATVHFPTPSSPLPFGCLPSPRSPYPSLFSPTTLGFQQFPLSPTVPSP